MRYNKRAATGGTVRLNGQALEALNDMIIPQAKNNLISGVYEIVNTLNGHRYIGSAVAISKRWNEHIRHLNTNKHHSAYLQRAWIKYGADCFECVVIEYCEKEKLIEREQFYIDTLNPVYNVCKKAGNMSGYKHTDKSRKKMSDKRKGENNVMYGKHHTASSIQQISDSKKGTPAWNKGKKGLYSASDETRIKLSAAHKGKSSWNKGIKTGKPSWNSGLSIGWNKGTKGLQVAWNKGVPMSDETKKKLSDSHKGIKLSEEHKKKISDSLIGNKRTLGYIPTEETRKKLSESRKKYLEEKRSAA